jgi:membrane-associated HD superfamily phosphohydrolase
VVVDMESRKVLSSLCYFSIFFAGFLFPLAVYFATGDQGTKRNAKSALLSHLILLIPTPLIVLAVFYDFTNIQDSVPVFTIISMVVLVLLWMVIIIWNIIKGVKALTAE